MLARTGTQSPKSKKDTPQNGTRTEEKKRRESSLTFLSITCGDVLLQRLMSVIQTL